MFFGREELLEFNLTKVTLKLLDELFELPLLIFNIVITYLIDN